MIEKIKKFFFNREVNSLGEVKRTARLLNLTDIKSVGILFDTKSNDLVKSVHEVERDLINQGKSVSLLGFVDSKDEKINFGFPIFNLKSVDWKYIPSGQIVESFLNLKSDLLIVVTSQEVPSIDFITIKSISNCKVGFFVDEKKTFFDFMIKPSSPDYNSFFKQLFFYLNKINNSGK